MSTSPEQGVALTIAVGPTIPRSSVGDTRAQISKSQRPHEDGDRTQVSGRSALYPAAHLFHPKLGGKQYLTDGPGGWELPQQTFPPTVRFALRRFRTRRSRGRVDARC